MVPKPGNAFAQQKELQRQKFLETQHREEDLPATPTTTMSMFIDTDLPQIGSQAPAELKTPINIDHSHKPVAGRGKLGRRSFTDPLDATAARFPGTAEPSPFGKQSSGLGYIKSKFTGKKKNKDLESPAQPFTKPVPSEYLSNIRIPATMSNTRKTGAAPEAAATTREKFPSQPLPSHLSTTTTQSIATRQSRYASLLKNDAMILGNVLMSPTRSGSYAIAGYPAVVGANRRSIASMAGSILEASPPNFGGSGNADVFINSSAQPEYYDSTLTAPLPPPPGDNFEQHEPFQQQLPFYLQVQPYERHVQTNFECQPFSTSQHEICNTGTWERLHAQYPGTMPQFSPMNPQHLCEGNPERQTRLAQASDHADETNELQKAWITASLYNANASDTKSESGKEALGAFEDAEHTAADIAIPLGGSLRRSVSNQELKYSTYRSESPDRTPVARKEGKPSIQPTISSWAMSPTAPVFRPTDQENSTTMAQITLKPDRYEGEQSKQSEPAQNLSQNIRENVSSLLNASTPSYDKTPGQAYDPKGKERTSAQGLRDWPTRGGYPPTPQHPTYQARSNMEEQMAHQFNVVHHHMEADKYTLRRCIEDAKNHLADKSSSGIDDIFRNQFRQMCIQNNGFRQYLERIQQQTSDLRPGIATDVLPGVSVEMASRFAAHEHRYKEEFRRINKNLLTLNENFFAIQRNLHNQMAQMSRKMDLLLEAQGIDTSSGAQHARPDQDAMQQNLHEEAQRRQGEVVDPATIVAEEKEVFTTAAACAFGASSPTMQIATPPTKTRKPTPLPTKLPIMAAALTSTPPHVPQLPQSQSQSSSIATITIRDPSIPSPSAVTNARRIRHGHPRGQGDARKENKRTGIMAKGLANATSLQAPGSHVHPALRYQEDLERLAGGKEKEQTEEKPEDADNQVLWRRLSGDGEIGGRWYQAAMQQ